MKNVILITIDTMRKDVFGCYSSKHSLTSFMDSLQDSCIRFERAYATGPYTQASFPGILTSSYYLEYGKQKNLPAQKTLISEVLKPQGITTSAFHSNPYLSDFFGYNRGWEMFYASMEDDVTDLHPFIRGNVINRKVSAWLSSHTKSIDYNPFFLWVHYMDVHEPYIPEKIYLEKVDSSIDLSKEEMYALFKEVILKRDASNTDTVKLLNHLYSAKVLEVDDYIKELFNIFEDTGVLKDSIIFFGSDHGDEFGEHDGLSHDGKMYSELIGVPLFIYYPDRKENEVYGNPVSNVDISPTIAYLFGIKEVGSFKGVPLLPLHEYPKKGCFGEAINKRGHKEKETDRPIYYYLKNDLKVIFDEGNSLWEMFNLSKDPGELHNIIDTSPLAENMKNHLIDWIKTR
jgi:arylsulfatase A-like enzyme